jgi:hypothetical protein
VVLGQRGLPASVVVIADAVVRQHVPASSTLMKRGEVLRRERACSSAIEPELSITNSMSTSRLTASETVFSSSCRRPVESLVSVSPPSVGVLVGLLVSALVSAVESVVVESSRSSPPLQANRRGSARVKVSRRPQVIVAVYSPGGSRARRRSGGCIRAGGASGRTGRRAAGRPRGCGSRAAWRGAAGRTADPRVA